MLPYDTERHAKGIFVKLLVAWLKNKEQTPSEAQADALAVAAIGAAQDFSEAVGLFALPHSGTGLPDISKVLTFEQLVQEWQGRGLKVWEQRNRKLTLSRFQRYVFPTLAGRPATQIAPHEILAVLRGVEDAGYLPMAHQILGEMKSLYRFAVASGYAYHNPAAEIKRGLYRRRARTHPAILVPTRIGELLRGIDTYQGRTTTKTMMQIMPYVFVRPSELRKAEWSEIDFKASEWRLPAHRMKGRRPHIVPLAEQVKERLRRLRAATGPSRFLFPGMSRDKPIAGSHFRAILCDLGFRGEMTPSGFRSMAATQLSEHGWNADAIERQLSHFQPLAVARRYNFAEYLPERRRMMQWWADYLDKLAGRKRIGAQRTRPKSKESVPKEIRNEKVCKSVADLIEESGGSIAQFARELSRVSGERVPYNRVYDWRARNHIPRRMVLHVYRLTGTPTEGLLRERALNAAQSRRNARWGRP